MDELEAIEAGLKECLQELDNGELLSAENDGGADMKEDVNGLKTESNCDGEGGRKHETSSVGSDSTFQPDGGQESEKVLQWREAFQKRVQGKDAEEEKAKALWLKTAKKELEKFYKREANSSRQFSETKEEAKHTENLRRNGGLGDGGTGNIWKRAVELCDFDTKAKSTKDVSRMRSVIQALSDPPADAPPLPPTQ